MKTLTEFLRWFGNRDLREPWHAERYAHSLEWLRPLVGSGTKILETGGQTEFSEAFQLAFPGVDLHSTGSCELRDELPYSDAEFDGILFMEIIEHLKDRHDDSRDQFTGSGIVACLKEFRRIIRPGGFLFLTTPNVCGWIHLNLLIQHKHPFSYPPHHREFAPVDVLGYVRKTGFSVRRIDTLDVWQTHGLAESHRRCLTKAILDLGGDLCLREDCLFLIAFAE